MQPGDRVWFLKMPGVVVQMYGGSGNHLLNACELFVGSKNTYGHPPRHDVYTDGLSERTIEEPVDREWASFSKARGAK
jgi:hypothetical protein